MDLAERLNRIHADVVTGEPTAPLTLFQAALGPLAGVVRRRFSAGGDDIAHDIATDAILHYLEDPSCCDLTKGSLWALLYGIVTRDAIDAARLAGRRASKQDAVEFHVELWASQTNDNEQVENAIDARKIMETFGSRLIRQPQDEKLLNLILQQESRTDQFAHVLGLDPAAPDVERSVKQAKDRMLLRLKRLRDEL